MEPDLCPFQLFHLFSYKARFVRQAMSLKAVCYFCLNVTRLFGTLDTGWRFWIGFTFWTTEKTKTRVFLWVIPKWPRFGEVLGDGGSRPTSSGSTTARGVTKWAGTLEKSTQKARVRAGRTKARTQNCDAGNTNISSYYREGEQAGPFCCLLSRAKMPIILFFYDVKQWFVINGTSFHTFILLRTFFFLVLRSALQLPGKRAPSHHLSSQDP